MAHITADRVKDTTTTTGTGAITLSGTSPSGFRTFASVMATADTCYYAIVGPSEWEVGVGTFTTPTTLARTTVLSSSTGSAVSFSAGSKDVFITLSADQTIIEDPDHSIDMVGISAEPVNPATGHLKFYAKDIGGRMMPKVLGAVGVDTALQPALFTNRMVMFMPSNGTVGTGLTGFSPAWTSNGTVLTPTPATTAPALSNQMKRTRYANVVTTTNQQLGPRFNSATEQQFWRGNAAGLGGFYFYSRFIVELYPASTVRIFSGLTSTATGSVAISDTVLANTCGLWHDTTDPSSGANSFNFVSKDATTATKQSIPLTNAIAAGNSYDFAMFCAPNGAEIFWRLVDLVNNITYSGSKTTNLPAATAFMQPQTQMSNGTANITVTTTAIGVVSIYVESDF